MSSRVREAIAAIDASIQFAPKACREAMEQARAVLADVTLDIKECTPEQRLADLMLQIKPTGAPLAHRRRLPDERTAITHKFSIVGCRGYLTVGEFEDGSPGELFLQFGEDHASRNPLVDQFAIAVSMLLQVGVPIGVLVNKFRNTKFEPSGFTGNPDIPRTTSPLDYVFAWIAKRYIEPDVARTPWQLLMHFPEAEAAASSGIQEAVAPAPAPETTVAEKGETAFERCRGDGKYGCGHAKHVGPCKSIAVAPAGPCRCTGS